MVSNVHLHLTTDGIPILGGIFENENDAMNTVYSYINLAKKKQSLPTDSFDEISLEFIRQLDQRFKLIINFGDDIGCIEELHNIDELMLRKFKKNLKEKSYFILTAFYPKEEILTSLLTSQSLGLIIYKTG